MLVTYLDFAAAFSVFCLLGVSLFGCAVAFVASPTLVNVASVLCIIGGTGVLATVALRAFKKRS